MTEGLHSESSKLGEAELSTKLKRERVPDRLSAVSIGKFLLWYSTEIVHSLRLAARRWKLDDASSMAAAVAYYLALSVFPMLLLLSSGIGLFLKFTNMGQDAESQILAIVAEHCSESLEEQIRMMLAQFEEQSLVGGPFGLLTAIGAAIGVFYQFERAFDKIWRIPPGQDLGALGIARQLVGKRLVAFLMLGSVGLTIVSILIANIALGALRDWMIHLHLPGALLIALVDACATMLLNILAFAVLYRTLPKRRVLWRDAFRVGLLIAITWEIGREVLCTFFIGMRYTTAYGAIGSFIALLLWFYWGVNILFFGAEYLQVISLRHRKPFSMFDAEKCNESQSNRQRPATIGIDSSEELEHELQKAHLRPRRRASRGPAPMNEQGSASSPKESGRESRRKAA